MTSTLGATYKELIAKIDALRAEAKAAASDLLHQDTKQYFEKYKDFVEQIFWNQYTPWFNDGETCEFSVGEPSVVLHSDEDESKYTEGSYFPIDVEATMEAIATWELYLKDPEAYKDSLGVGYFTRWNTRDTYSPHYKSLSTLQEELESLQNYPDSFITDTKELLSFISSVPEDIMEELFGNHVTIRISINGIEIEEYNHE